MEKVNFKSSGKSHIFLTGEVRVGKSTVLSKVLAMIGLSYGGFKTYFGEDRDCPDKNLYINEASMPPSFGEENIVARFRNGMPPEPILENFNRLGTEYIANARKNSRLIVMDECGNIERDAFVFQKEILNTLDGDKPVLGVLKLAATGWAENIRNHPKVYLVTVNKSNRDSLPEYISDLIIKTNNTAGQSTVRNI